jgi:DNA polymerase III gamma/tau subunit
MEAEADALFWIAKSASGSMRDAESVLDQMISYCEGIIKEEDVFYVLGMPSYDIYHSFARSIAEGDFKTCISLLDKLVHDGVEISILNAGLIEYYRNLYILSADEGTADLIDLPEQDIDTMKSLLSFYTRKDINNILILLAKAYQDVKNSGLARELLEITLIKLLHYKEIIHPASLLKRLEELKQQVTGGTEIITHFSNKRRAIAEFLKRAKSYNFNDSLVTITYEHKEKYSYEHVSEDSVQRYIERELNDFLQRDIRVHFIIEKGAENQKDDAPLSPDVSRVLEVFKGEIVPKNYNGGN